MPFKVTENSLIVTGPESPVDALEVDGYTLDFTAYKGSLSDITQGTPYALALFGYAGNDAAFDVPKPPHDESLISLVIKVSIYL